jgi:hypothetical protein
LTVTKHDNINHIGTCCKNCRWALNESDNNSYIGEKCKNCDGTGLLLNSEYCSNCRGSGFVNYNIHYGYCLECNCIKCNNKHNNCRCLNTENYDILISFLLKNPIEMDKYIRTILGQMIFVSGENHLRFNYDCTCSSDIEYNRYIIDMFTMFYNNQRIAMYTSEGSIEVCVIPLNKYSKHDYWNDIDLCNGMKIYNYSGDGTVMIITKILHLLNNSNIPDDFVKIPDKLYIENTMSV